MSENKEIKIGYNLTLALIVMSVCCTVCIALISLKSLSINANTGKVEIEKSTNPQHGNIRTSGDSLFVNGNYTGRITSLGLQLDSIVEKGERAVWRR